MEDDDQVEIILSDSEKETETKSRYVKTRRVGEGTFAVVYEALDTATEPPTRVALKKIKLIKQEGNAPSGLDISAVRELKALRHLSANDCHPNIAPLLDVWLPPSTKSTSMVGNLHFVLPFYDFDLEAMIKDSQIVFSPADIKTWMWMMLSGIEFCHERDIIHRDLKPGNLLVDGKTGYLKLADFGLARDFSFPSGAAMTPRVVTRWYRAPELLFGARLYTGAVDIWAAGCIFAELMLRTPFLPGDSDLNQLTTIFRALGTPTDWPDMKELPDYVPFQSQARPPLRSIFTAASDDALDLLDRMLTFNPAKRITAKEALEHFYFKSAPHPTEPSKLPRPVPKASAGKVVAAYLVASVLNASKPESVEFVWKAAGSVPQSFQLMEGGAVVAEGSLACAQALIAKFARDESVEAKDWIKFALESLVGNDFAKLSGSYARLNEHLKFRTFMNGVEGPSCVDALVWSQLRLSPVWGKLVKTPGSAAGAEASRWYNFLAEKSFAAALATFAEQAKALKEKKKDQGSFAIDLEGAEMGKVVTRFPPEPSGYLHIGHAKAAMLNQYFAQIYKGKMIVRFDDTNPSKEKCEFEESIIEDLALLGVKGDIMSHTSDFFPEIEKYCEMMLREGTAYADNTPLEKMREERFDGIESACRNQSPEENLRIWEEMKQGTPSGLTYCIRAKMDMSANNKALRDPVMYRCNLTPHHRTGTTYKVYPTYDFACPIVDSVEGVTHALRTNEYHDRNDQYAWFLKTLRLRKVSIWDYSRLNFVYTLLSKRKLTWFVNEGRVTGWDDPRFPTVRGIRRRGLTIEALREYILMQGASKNTILLEWDKLWSINKRIIDPVAPRYVALAGDHLCRVKIVGGEGCLETAELREIPRHKKNPQLGNKQMAFSANLFMEQADVSALKVGEEFTLMDWGNAIVESIEMADANTVACISVKLNLQGDFKKTTLKATWLSPDPQPLVPLSLHDYDYLITKKKLEEEDTLDDCLTPVTEFVTPAVGDANLAKDVKVGDIIQLERKGFFIVDEVPAEGELSQARPIRLIAIPDGRAKSIASKHA